MFQIIKYRLFTYNIGSRTHCNSIEDNKARDMENFLTHKSNGHFLRKGCAENSLKLYESYEIVQVYHHRTTAYIDVDDDFFISQI